MAGEMSWDGDILMEMGEGGMGAREHQRRIIFDRSHAFLTEYGRKSRHPTKRFAGCIENCGDFFFLKIEP